MNKKIIGLVIVSIPSLVYAENYLPNYGYYENGNEITAKDRLIPETSQIFDFNTSPNPGGETIQDGRYYVPVQYNGGYNGTDTDYLYVDELIGKDGEKGDKGDTGLNGNNGSKGDKGDKGDSGLNGSDADAKVAEEKIAIETQTRIESEKRINTNLITTNNRVNALDNRVSNLEETKMLVDVEARLFDKKYIAMSVYNSYDYRHQRNSAIGLKFLFKVGKSYEETRIEELENKIKRLMQAMNNRTLSFAITSIEEK